MAEFKSDYLKYDASQIEILIKQKLAENPLFTDFIFDDSNLTTLIQVFSHMFQTLQYYLNKGASEAIFADSVLYENMSRLVKMLSYNPLGYAASQTEAIFATLGQSATDPTSTRLITITQAILPKYTFVNTNLTDSRGNQIFYSMTNNRFITPDSNGILDSSNSVDKTLFINGRWKLYDTTFIANGVAFEEFTLSLLDLDDDENPRYLAHPYIDVYIKTPSTSTSTETYELYTPVSQGTLFNNNGTLLGPEDNVFELRLNENKQYTITFGDGLRGTRLKEGDEVYIVYLESNGPDGAIGTDFFTSTNKLDYSIAGMSETLFNAIIDVDVDSLLPKTELQKLYLKNLAASTTFADFETVDEIRANAPIAFRTGERLITGKDYENYIKANFRADIVDIKAMNNYEYMAKFLDWLRQYNLLVVDVREGQYVFADSCDFNNVYLWTKYRSFEIDSSIIEEELAPRKVLTAEPIILPAIKYNIVPSLKNNNYDTTGNIGWDPDIENWIEIEKNKNSLISADRIKNNVIKIFKDFFNPELYNIGSTVDVRELHQRILGLDGVASVKTAYLSKANQDAGRCALTQYFEGLFFAGWTNTILDAADLEFFSGNKKTLDFQYPELVDDTQLQLDKRIKIVFTPYGTKSIEY